MKIINSTYLYLFLLNLKIFAELLLPFLNFQNLCYIFKILNRFSNDEGYFILLNNKFVFHFKYLKIFFQNLTKIIIHEIIFLKLPWKDNLFFHDFQFNYKCLFLRTYYPKYLK